MGAIAVFLSRVGPPDPEMARRMLEAAPHRGDQHSVDVIGQAALAVSNDADWVTATMARHDNQIAVFCGSLDNNDDLRADLRRAGAREPAARTPAATLLAAFGHWGEEAIRRLRGSFTGVITDGRTLTCFRDQFGLRPLFHHDGRGGFFAATEVKQVLAGAAIPREPDLDHLHGVLFGGLSLSTAFRGVNRIPKWTIASSGTEPGVTLRQYWDPITCVETASLGLKEALEGTVEALHRAVRRVLTGHDVILLSGGLDSPALAAFAVQAQDPADPVKALTFIYPDYPSTDEREWTQMAANHLGIPLHECVADAGSLDDIEDWVTILDGPVDILSIPESAESYAAARSLGARTVSNGEIAEMLFESRAYLLDHLLSHGRIRAAASRLAERRKAGRTRWKIARQIIGAVAPPRLVSAYRNRHPNQLRGLPAWVDEQRLTSANRRPPMYSISPRRRWIEMQTAPFIGPGISFEADEICAAWCGVDSRRPFADVDLWEFVLSLPAEVKFPNRRPKPLLREAMRGLLPDELLDRRDKTFFDEFHLAKADYAKLKRLLVDTPRHLEGIDYNLLRDRLAREDMQVYELQWARNVARIHAFLSQC